MAMTTRAINAMCNARAMPAIEIASPRPICLPLPTRLPFPSRPIAVASPLVLRAPRPPSKLPPSLRRHLRLLLLFLPQAIAIATSPAPPPPPPSPSDRHRYLAHSSSSFPERSPSLPSPISFFRPHPRRRSRRGAFDNACMLRRCSTRARIIAHQAQPSMPSCWTKLAASRRVGGSQDAIEHQHHRARTDQ